MFLFNLQIYKNFLTPANSEQFPCKKSGIAFTETHGPDDSGIAVNFL